MAWIRRLREGTLLGRSGRDVTYLSAGAALAQTVLMLGQIVLARQYSKADFGSFSIAVAVGSLLAVVATMRYEMAVPLAGDEDESDALVRLCLLTSSVATVAMYAGLALGWAAGWFDIGGAEPLWGMGTSLWLVPAISWAVAAYTAVRMLASRRNQFAAVGKATVTGAITQVVGQIAGGLAGLGGLGLNAGYLLGRVVNTMGMSPAQRTAPEGTSRRLVGINLGRPVRPELTSRQLMNRWRRMPIYSTLPALLNGLTVGAVAPVVGLLFGVVFAGSFGFATRLLAAPSALLGQAVASVFYPAMARLDREGADPSPQLLRLTSALTLVSLPVFVPVLLLGPQLFTLLFGSVWRDAGVIAALLAPWLAASFVSSPLSTYATVRDRLGRMFAVSLVETALRAGGLVIGYVLGDPMLGVGLYSAAGVLICVYFVVWTLRLGGTSAGLLTRRIGDVLGATALAIGVGFAAQRVLAEPWSVLVGVISCVGLAALAGLRLRQLIAPVRVTAV